jgi:hypothetical protein
VRAWLGREPWGAAVATGLVTATIVSFALWAVLPYAVAGPPGPKGDKGNPGIPGIIAGKYATRDLVLVSSGWKPVPLSIGDSSPKRPADEVKNAGTYKNQDSCHQAASP